MAAPAPSGLKRFYLVLAASGGDRRWCDGGAVPAEDGEHPGQRRRHHGRHGGLPGVHPGQRRCAGRGHRVRRLPVPGLCGLRRGPVSVRARAAHRHRPGAVAVPGLPAATSIPSPALPRTRRPAPTTRASTGKCTGSSTKRRTTGRCKSNAASQFRSLAQVRSASTWARTTRAWRARSTRAASRPATTRA